MTVSTLGYTTVLALFIGRHDWNSLVPGSGHAAIPDSTECSRSSRRTPASFHVDQSSTGRWRHTSGNWTLRQQAHSCSTYLSRVYEVLQQNSSSVYNGKRASSPHVAQWRLWKFSNGKRGKGRRQNGDLRSGSRLELADVVLKRRCKLLSCFTIIFAVFLHDFASADCLPNFVQAEPLTAKLWRHIDF